MALESAIALLGDLMSIAAAAASRTWAAARTAMDELGGDGYSPMTACAILARCSGGAPNNWPEPCARLK